MKIARTTALVLAIGVITALASAQEEARTAQSAEQLVPATFASIATPMADPLNAPPDGNALVRATAPATPEQQHRFFDRQQLLALYVHAGVRLADTVKTCRAISHGGVEDWIPTQSCAGITAWQTASVGLTLGVGWLFHKHGHHTLERITPWVGTGASVAGLTKSVFNVH